MRALHGIKSRNWHCELLRAHSGFGGLTAQPQVYFRFILVPLLMVCRRTHWHCTALSTLSLVSHNAMGHKVNNNVLVKHYILQRGCPK